MHAEPLAIFLLGLLMGYMSWHFVMRGARGQISPEVFAAVLGVLAGGALIRLFEDFLRTFNDVWWYPIGLVVGVGLYILVGLINDATPGGTSPSDDSGRVFPTVFGVFKRSGPRRP
jgi:hypothetical protein